VIKLAHHFCKFLALIGLRMAQMQAMSMMMAVVRHAAIQMTRKNRTAQKMPCRSISIRSFKIPSEQIRKRGYIKKEKQSLFSSMSEVAPFVKLEAYDAHIAAVHQEMWRIMEADELKHNGTPVNLMTDAETRDRIRLLNIQIKRLTHKKRLIERKRRANTESKL
jgi:hypothetical protein